MERDNQAQEVLQAKHRVHQQIHQRLYQYGKETKTNSGEEDSYYGAQSKDYKN